MSETVGDFILQRLSDWGIRQIFGYPGDGINGLMGALGRAEDRFNYTRVRHEEMAAFMACAYAKFTGDLGVCFATSGPGAIHLLNGLYDAKMDHMPVLAIVGQQARTALGSDYQQEVDLQVLFQDVSDYVETAMAPAQVRHILDRAIRISKSENGVSTLIVPNDLQEMDAVASPPRSHGNVYSGVGYSAPRIMPDESDLRRAADVLNAGAKVAMLVGAGALKATDEVLDVAEKLGAGIAKALLGKAVVPDDLPFVTGSIGLLGTKPSWELMTECDTLLMVGTTFPYVEFLPKDGKVRAVQIDVAPRNMSIRYPTEVNLVGDAAAVLRQLSPLLKPREDDKWRKKITDNVASWWNDVEDRAMQPANPINPQRVFTEMSSRLPDHSILCGDCGSHTNWYARNVRMRRGMMGSLSGKLATMGSGMPYAIAAKTAYPDRPVIAMVGDGAMQMNGNAELITVKEYWKRWDNPCFVVLVLHNNDLNQVTWEQRVLAGDPKFEPSQDVEDFPYARYADLLGLKGIRIDNPDDIGRAWDEAFASDCPVVLDFITDPDVPPLPPHIKWEQAKAYMSTLAKDDPNEAGIIKQTARQVMAGVMPHRDKENP
ncbi:MAG TPA: thiamine pyrophosphate-requiring protein [Rhodanobacteraceae bacterium]|nr:thiamine pyrophosphate-requiring protein [Rhodanobacteraceae bacterium]